MLSFPLLGGFLHKHFLYHIGLDTSMDLKGMFKDITYVIMQGSPDRARDLAFFLSKELNVPFDGMPVGKTERYSMYIVGPVLCLSHGIGMASLSIILHEVYKLLHYAGRLEHCTFLRSGTCGGVGAEPGTVAITTEGLDPQLNRFYSQSILGKLVQFPSIADPSLVSQLKEVAEKHSIPYVCGGTISAEGFYEDQGRTDGFFCEYEEEDKFAFLQRVHEEGVKNIEMEALLFLAFAQRANVRAGVMCTVIVNRLNGDQVSATHEQLDAYMQNNWRLLARLVEAYP